jgi:hypothetical protein
MFGSFVAGQETGSRAMTFFYISDDLENEIRRCIQSWEFQDPITITGVTVEGQIKDFTGTVQTIHRDRRRAAGRLWRVTIRELKPPIVKAGSRSRAAASVSSPQDR